MENFGFKGLLVTLYQRVVLSWKSSLIGLGIDAAGVAIDYMAHSPNHNVAKVFAIVGTLFLLVKDRWSSKPASPQLVP